MLFISLFSSTLWSLFDFFKKYFLVTSLPGNHYLKRSVTKYCNCKMTFILTRGFFSIWVLLITWKTHQEVVVWLIFYNVASNVLQWLWQEILYIYKICWELSTFVMAVPAAVGDYTKRPSEAARRLQEAMCALTYLCYLLVVVDL